MVNGVALSTMIGGGWGGGAVLNATGMAEFAIVCRAWTRRPRPAACASTVRGMAAISWPARFSGLHHRGFASDTHWFRRRGTRLSAAADQGNGDFNPGVGGPIARDKVCSSGISLRGCSCPACSSPPAVPSEPVPYVSTGEQAIIHQTSDASLASFTQASHEQFGVTTIYKAVQLSDQISETVSPRPRSIAGSRCSDSFRTGTTR
jgi:hypothetical protein